MKRALLFIGLTVLLGDAGSVWAQLGAEPQDEKYLRLPHRFQIFADGGIGMPTDPGLFNDYWNASFQFGVGFGVAILPWLEVNGTFNSLSFSNNSIESKTKVGYQGIEAVEGGAIHTKMYYGSARFIGVPKARTNPYVEFGVGYFSTSADDLVIESDDSTEPILQNSMESVSGICVVPSMGVQYAMNDSWTAYTKYTYAMNLNGDFRPGDLLLPVGETTPTVGDNQIISSFTVGVMVTF
jgi:opacity protein-like surface antigen